MLLKGPSSESRLGNSFRAPKNSDASEKELPLRIDRYHIFVRTPKLRRRGEAVHWDQPFQPQPVWFDTRATITRHNHETLFKGLEPWFEAG